MLVLTAACAFAVDTADWMRGVRDDAPLRRIAIPGAHDAGTAGMPWYSRTQDADTATLLADGVRYLDLRVALEDGKLRIFHGPSTGVELDGILQAVAAFLDAHPAECVLLDFQHFQGGAEQPALAALTAALGQRIFAAPNPQDKVGCINSLPLSAVRGRVVVFWGSAQDPQLADPRLFLRGNDAGTRTNACLHSFYNESAHMGESKALIGTTLPQYLARFASLDSGICVLQGQLTDGWGVRGPRSRENTHAAAMDAFVSSLANSPHLPAVNVILRDFATAEKNAKTIGLNRAKGFFK
ncbi:MAG: phosphatidylinositol-specific phospholipase C domain-containing protein [Akkermansia sp.]|nr:phosphatidylinositol-specific phospholipase C domain-containing protein [Akkermansia sp.]